MRQLMIEKLLEIQKIIKGNKILKWNIYEFMYDENLKENLEKLDDNELFNVYNRIYGYASTSRG